VDSPLDRFPPVQALLVESVEGPVGCLPGKILEEALPPVVAKKSRLGFFFFPDKIL
jgi:hypothetical protein